MSSPIMHCAKWEQSGEEQQVLQHDITQYFLEGNNNKPHIAVPKMETK